MSDPITPSPVRRGVGVIALALGAAGLFLAFSLFSRSGSERFGPPAHNGWTSAIAQVRYHLFTLLGLGERLHPELDEIYITSPDRVRPDPVSAAELKHAWSEVNGKLTAAFEKLTPQQWLEKHTAVSDEDFAKDPTRNRLAVLLSRTNHAAFHTGQAALIK